VSRRITLATVSAGMPAESSGSLLRSDVPSYDNLTRIRDAAVWSYNGGPNLQGTYSGESGWLGLLSAYCPARPDKVRYEWSYSTTSSVELAAALNPKRAGGCINGYVTGDASVAAFGSRTLYGARWVNNGGPNSFADPTDPAEQARLLGDDANAASYAENMRGISNWASAAPAVTVMLHDDSACAWATHSTGGSFRDSSDVGFTAHGTGSYRAYLRGLYANDEAYDAARAAGTVPFYAEYRQHLLTKLNEWQATAGKRARAVGMEYVLNVAGPLPTKHPQTPFVLVKNADYGMCELGWQTYCREGTSGRMVTDRATAENLSDATTLRNMFASMALSALTMRGAGRRATFAVYPLVDWLPAKATGAADSPPSTSPYTVPAKVSLHQRISWAWLQALGCPSVLPAGILDEAAGDVAGYGFTGYSGNNKPLYYMDPALASPWFKWVASRSDILDDFDLAATVAIIQPMLTDFWRGAVDGSSNSYWRWTNDYCRPLIEAGVPFVILPVDAELGFGGYDTSKYRAVITASGNSLTLPGSLSDYSPVVVTGSTDATRSVFCVPRVDRAQNRLALHVVNTNSANYTGAGSANSAQSAIQLKLKPWAMLGRRILTARWYSHESTTQGAQVQMIPAHDGATVKVPAFVEAGVVVLEFA